MGMQAFAGREPRLRLEEFFLGRTRASGLFVDRFGKLRRQFQMEAEGHFDGDALTLAEHFIYDDGQAERRTWQLRPVGEHRYDAHTDDLVGPARGAAYGNVFNLTYRITLDLGGRRLPVRFDDWMFLQPDGTLINRAAVTKFGLLLGQVTCAFWRMPAELEPRPDRADTVGGPRSRPR